MEFEDYLVASGIRVQPEGIRGNTVQPDYKRHHQKLRHHSKTMQDSGLVCTLNKECLTYTQQMGETVKSKFLTYFNPIGSTKEQQIKTWKEMIWNLRKRN